VARFLALLRAVNVGKRKVPMGALRSLCTDLGFDAVATYIASGNLVFTASGRASAIEQQLERALEREFGFAVDVMVRTPSQFSKTLAATPFPKGEPSKVVLVVSKKKPMAAAPKALEERGKAGERAAIAGGALWIHYAGGIGKSKLTPALVDQAVGSPSTGRNLRTAQKLEEMLERD